MNGSYNRVHVYDSYKYSYSMSDYTRAFTGLKFGAQYSHTLCAVVECRALFGLRAPVYYPVATLAAVAAVPATVQYKDATRTRSTVL